MSKDSKVPSFDNLIAPMVSAFKAQGGSMTVQETEDAVAELLNLPESIRAVPHGDGPYTKFGYNLAWARTYLKKVEALSNSSRGIWSLTPTGTAMTDA